MISLRPNVTGLDKATKWSEPSNKTAKTELPCQSKCDKIKDLSLLKGHGNKT